jgi:tetratricopeptide (TPR) repeat protein
MRLGGAASILAGLVLAATALPLVPASLHRLAADAALHEAAEQDTLSRRNAALDRAETEIRSALSWRGTPEDLRRLALIAQHRGARDEARRLLAATLRHAPADPVAWTRLAALRDEAGDATGSVAALTRALAVAPAARHLAVARAALILRHWPRMRERVAASRLRVQLRLALRQDTAILSRIARADGREAVLIWARTSALDAPPPPPR